MGLVVFSVVATIVVSCLFQSTNAVVLTARQGEITSRNYPVGYPHNTNQTWTIFGGPGTIIKLSFTNVSIEGHSTCNYDKVQVFKTSAATDDNLLATVCGYFLPEPATYESDDGTMVVIFTSDRSISGRGFRAEYTIQDVREEEDMMKRDIADMPKCGPDQTSAQGVITSPGYPNRYPHNTQCSWTIRGGQGDTVQLTFTNISMEFHPRCIYDSIKIYESSSVSQTNVIGQLCDSPAEHTPITFDSNEHHMMMVVFKSDASISRHGFRAEYSIQGAPSTKDSSTSGKAGKDIWLGPVKPPPMPASP